MSSEVMSGLLSSRGAHTVTLSALSKTAAQLSQSEKKFVIEGLISILEEDRLRPWYDTGLRDEFERRYHTLLPTDWLQIVEETGPDVIELERISLTNVTKTLVQLPIRKSKTGPRVANSCGPTQPKPSSAAIINLRDEQKEKPKVSTANRVETSESRAVDQQMRAETTAPGSPTPEPKVAQLISLSPERPNPNHKPQSISSLVANNPMNSPSYKSLIEAMTPGIEQMSISVPNPVPNAIDSPVNVTNSNGVANQAASGVLNGTGDEPKAVPNGTSMDRECTLEFMNGTVEDVIFGGKPIPPPVLPPVKPIPVKEEDFFDVVVLLAANPYNFIVAPFKNMSKSSEFFNLKQKMHEMYDKEENRIELPPSVIQKGIFVAAKEKDKWYRVRVVSVLSESPFLVVGYLCDVGEHKTFDLHNIQPLYNCFRSLPMQAIRATLATVTPIGSDWDVITSYEFRQMVENKPFVCTVYDVKEVDSEPVISVSLCDTSGDDDVYVGSALVKKRLAQPVVLSAN